MGQSYQDGARQAARFFDPEEDSLEAEEENYRYELDNIHVIKDPQKAADHLEYMRGLIEATRWIFQAHQAQV